MPLETGRMREMRRRKRRSDERRKRRDARKRKRGDERSAVMTIVMSLTTIAAEVEAEALLVAPTDVVVVTTPVTSPPHLEISDSMLTATTFYTLLVSVRTETTNTHLFPSTRSSRTTEEASVGPQVVTMVAPLPSQSSKAILFEALLLDLTVPSRRLLDITASTTLILSILDRLCRCLVVAAMVVGVSDLLHDMFVWWMEVRDLRVSCLEMETGCLAPSFLMRESETTTAPWSLSRLETGTCKIAAGKRIISEKIAYSSSMLTFLSTRKM
jgi:hypothetical protein